METDHIFSDDDLKTMYAKAAKLQDQGCSAEQCLMIIGQVINADILIHGSIKKESEKISVFAKLLLRNKKTDEQTVKSIVTIDFHESQVNWYTEQIVKKLLDSGYTITHPQKTTDLGLIIDLKELTIAEIKELDIQGLKFQSDDQAMLKLFKLAEEEVKMADNSFKAKEYRTALEAYSNIIRKIENQLTSESFKYNLSRYDFSILSHARLGSPVCFSI